ncbi:protein of unknown function [Burkholderia sp. D7]|nr:protein of unknown function [Burkholderia sp. D7]
MTSHRLLSAGTGPASSYARYAEFLQEHAPSKKSGCVSDFLEQLTGQAQQVVRRDVTPGFIVAELISFLNEHKVERPGYTTLQTVISQVLSAERQRLAELLSSSLDEATRQSLTELLVRDETLSELAAFKQDARDFGARQMTREREKRAHLETLYVTAKQLLPRLAISQQNLHHYASLANFYTVYDLRRMKAEQANLYLLCYAWQRYRQLTDNLVDAVTSRPKLGLPSRAMWREIARGVAH